MIHEWILFFYLSLLEELLTLARLHRVAAESLDGHILDHPAIRHVAPLVHRAKLPLANDQGQLDALQRDIVLAVSHPPQGVIVLVALPGVHGSQVGWHDVGGGGAADWDPGWH